MRIDEMTNDQASDAIIRISAALSFIFDDDEVYKLLKEINDEENMTLIVGLTKYMPKITAMAFRKHKDSMYEIVGALSGKSTKDVGKMSFVESMKLLQENWEVLKDFFPSTDSSTVTTDTASA